jgi:hypothetical protein
MAPIHDPHGNRRDCQATRVGLVAAGGAARLDGPPGGEPDDAGA